MSAFPLSGLCRIASVSLLACAPLFLPVAAQAVPQTRIFTVHDLDRDGRLSREEYRIFIEYRQRWGGEGRGRGRGGGWGRGRGRFSEPLAFDDIDADHDDFISESELVDALATQRHQRRGRGFHGGRGGWR